VAAELTWNGSEFRNYLKKATAAGIKRATIYLHTEAKRAVSKPNSGKDVKSPSGSVRIYPNPSKPGEPPRLRTGWGRRHIVFEFDESKAAGRVGVSKPGLYMFYLEVGTRRISRRPWLLATLMNHKETLGRLAASGG